MRGIKLDIRKLKVLSGVLSAVIAVGAISMPDCGSKNEVSLQSPSLMGPDAVPFTELYSPAMDVDETEYVEIRLGNSSVNIDDYTIVAMSSYSDIASQFTKTSGNSVSYDGGSYWINEDTSLVTNDISANNDDPDKDFI